MSAHALFVAAAYAVSALGVAGLVGWILLDGRAQRRAINALETSGIRRRSGRPDGGRPDGGRPDGGRPDGGRTMQPGVERP